MRNSVTRLASLAAQASREMATAARGKERKVAVLGAAGGIGQPLSILMKVSPRRDRLQIVRTPLFARR